MQDHTTGELRPALVLGLSPTGLLIVRSLGRRSVPVFGADFDPWGLARPSRYLTHVPELSEASGPRDGSVLCDALVRWAAGTGTRPVLYLTSDEYIELLCPFFDELDTAFLLSTRLDDAAATFLDKRRFYELCVDHDIDLPKTFFQADVDDIDAIADRLTYPAIIKPAFAHHLVEQLGGAKVLQILDRDELVTMYRRLAEVDDGLVVQEVIPGGDDHIIVAACYVRPDGSLGALFVGRKLRQYRPRFGSASLAVSEWDQEVADACAEFVPATGFRGLCGVEYKRDARDGSLKMIEINARCTLWMGLTTASGVDMPWVAYCDLVGLDAPPVEQRDGVKWAYLPRDLQSALQYFREGEITLGQWAVSVAGCRHEAVAAVDDPVPFAFVPLYAVRRMFEKRFGSG